MIDGDLFKECMATLVVMNCFTHKGSWLETSTSFVLQLILQAVEIETWHAGVSFQNWWMPFMRRQNWGMIHSASAYALISITNMIS